MFNAITLPEVQSGLSSLKDFVAIMAIMIGGWWTYMLFVKKRQKYPHANVEQHISHKLLTDRKTLLHVRVVLTNIGDVLLSLVSLETRISCILPLEASIEKDIDKGTASIVDEPAEIEWPKIHTKELTWKKYNCEIEPGEKDEFHFDFIFDSNIKTVSIYSYVENIKKRKCYIFWAKRDIGWAITTIYEMHDKKDVKV